MPAAAVVGAQWGDEGKGKVVDFLAERARIVIRYSGGDNAGHTVVNSLGLFRMHLIPSGIFHPHVTCIIGNGVVINPATLIEEMRALREAGLPLNNLIISPQAHLIMPYHIQQDKLEEQARGKKAIGTTQRGIGPAYADKAARNGIRVGDLLDREFFRERLSSILEIKNALFRKIFNAEPLSFEAIYEEYLRYAEVLAPFISDPLPVIKEALRRGDWIILEGAQGTLLDLDFGTYPFVTSSNPCVGGGCTGAGVSPREIREIIGVFKAFTTRVGSGPMPTELVDETGELLRERGREFGTTTGRPRRCGWFDAVLGRFAAEVNDFTSIALTKFDVLDPLPVVKICVAYKLEGRIIHSPPPSPSLLWKCEPIYEELPGWQTSTSGIRRFEDLPPAARNYIKRIEELVGRPIVLISVGPKREETIIRGELLGRWPE